MSELWLDRIRLGEDKSQPKPTEASQVVEQWPGLTSAEELFNQFIAKADELNRLNHLALKSVGDTTFFQPTSELREKIARTKAEGVEIYKKLEPLLSEKLRRDVTLFFLNRPEARSFKKEKSEPLHQG